MTPNYADRVFAFQRAIGLNPNVNAGEKFPYFSLHHPLIVSRPIDIYLLSNLQIAASLYLSANAKMPYSLSLSAVIGKYLEENPECLTKNGSVIPKQHAALEYNLFCRAFFRIIEHLQLDDTLVNSWTLPLNLRIRRGDTCNDKERQNPLSPAQPHSDSWLNECPDAGTAMLPIWGDFDNNNVEFFVPNPKKFDNSWITGISSYAEGQKNMGQYTSIGHNILEEGWITFSDFATAHASNIVKSPCGPRLSIDTVFGIKQKNNSNRMWRSERINLKSALNTHSFLMPQGKEGQWRDGKAGLVPAGHVSLFSITSTACANGI